jgi:hypothetical protein
MIEHQRPEFRTIQLLFGDGAHLVETGPAPGRPGRCEIRLDGRQLGAGPDFRSALKVATEPPPPGSLVGTSWAVPPDGPTGTPRNPHTLSFFRVLPRFLGDF